ncbi:imidazole glycerol phosphate synthase subunit HisH [bacterium]|nr:MAG: imidazole glycerol phosphate synthase subunit HisH [bacterium]
MPKIALIEYKAGNLASVSNALKRIGAEFIITNKHSELEKADGIIFPGVGHAQAAMESVLELNLQDFLCTTSKPVLGICVGMQLLFDSSEESKIPTLGLIPGHLQKFDTKQDKVPHMGWNKVQKTSSHPLLDGFDEHSWVYYVHSFYAPIVPETIAQTDYILPFSGVVAKDNIMGCQFHPEKSAHDGERFLKNFIGLL